MEPCDCCGCLTDLREPIDFDGAHLLVCQECAADHDEGLWLPAESTPEETP